VGTLKKCESCSSSDGNRGVHTGITGRRYRDTDLPALMNLAFLSCVINYTSLYLLATEGLTEIPL